MKSMKFAKQVVVCICLALSLSTLAPAGAQSSAPVAPSEMMNVGVPLAKFIEARAPDAILGSTRVWYLANSAAERTSIIEIRGHLPQQAHPDATHNLYVIDGQMTGTVAGKPMTLVAGDLITLTPNTSNGWDVAPGQRVLLLSMDAPPFDPAKTIWTTGEKPTEIRR
jgi:quercetin dioxygenase-like cupin family protein